jgi:anti-sigma B factor antagonist
MSAPKPQVPLSVQWAGNVTIVTFTADAVRDVENVIARELVGFTAVAGGHLLLDFGNVRYLNSVELGTLVSLHRSVQAAGGQLTLFNLDTRLHKLFSLTRLDTLLAVCQECAAECQAT